GELQSTHNSVAARQVATVRFTARRLYTDDDAPAAPSPDGEESGRPGPRYVSRQKANAVPPQFEDSAQAQMVASAAAASSPTPHKVSAVAPAVRAPRRPGDPPTRERKLQAITYDQVDAARALIKPQPQPKRKTGRGSGGEKIVFAPDDT